MTILWTCAGWFAELCREQEAGAQKERFEQCLARLNQFPATSQQGSGCFQRRKSELPKFGAKFTPFTNQSVHVHVLGCHFSHSRSDTFSLLHLAARETSCAIMYSLRYPQQWVGATRRKQAPSSTHMAAGCACPQVRICQLEARVKYLATQLKAWGLTW